MKKTTARLLVWLLLLSVVIPIPHRGIFAQTQAVTVSFQDGVLPSSAYAGTLDDYLSQYAPTVNYGRNSSSSPSPTRAR